ncbi:uncharacterized protein LOC120689980 [Panicum virgatum]|uniref:Uncharacterized protein n=1 Tax=Panicum virgatum TaxID=38727 RepID=A0A8T0MDN1_PANVG|nr:uncharacterized protein LOC120689980 [Panicum virgatum]KAG2534975.1 hypothetical protein PVAP13_9NG041100 [Panicum virgatum]
MAGAAVGVWLEAFAKFGRPEAAQAAGTEASWRRQGDGGAGVAEGGEKGGVVQEKRQRSSCGLSDSDTVACMLMDRFAPA